MRKVSTPPQKNVVVLGVSSPPTLNFTSDISHDPLDQPIRKVSGPE